VYESRRAVERTLRTEEGEEGFVKGSNEPWPFSCEKPKLGARSDNERVGVVGMLVARRGVQGDASKSAEAIGVRKEVSR